MIFIIICCLLHGCHANNKYLTQYILHNITAAYYYNIIIIKQTDSIKNNSMVSGFGNHKHVDEVSIIIASYCI